MKYPKINSLWKRQGQDMKGKLVIGDYASPEFGNIKLWTVQEKIDGMNIRVYWKRPIDHPMPKENKLFIHGRSDEAQVPQSVSNFIESTLTTDVMNSVFPIGEDKTSPAVILYGEGYGPKIQAGGGNYRKDVGFCLFDVFVNGWWLEQDAVAGIAKCLNLPYAPMIGIMDEAEIVEYIKSKPWSLCSIEPQVMEGVICRPLQLLRRRDGDPVIFKLKCKEF